MSINNIINPDTQPEAPADDYAISVKNLTKAFGDGVAVRDVTFNVKRAMIFGFIGPSGSGKTTMVRLLTGVYVPTKGQVSVLNIDPLKFNQTERSRVGYMAQQFVLYPNLTVWENINFAASLYGISLIHRSKRLRQFLEFVEIYDARRKLARNISGGMKRRLSLAAALVHDPELLFLDEPTAEIDPILRQKFWEHFKKLQEQGRTLFITTQYVNEADNCDLVGVMNKGRLLIVDTPQGLRRHVYGGNILELRTVDPIDYRTEQLFTLQGLKATRTGPNSMRIIVDQASTAIPELMALAQQNNLRVEALDQYLPPFEETFLELVKMEA